MLGTCEENEEGLADISCSHLPSVLACSKSYRSPNQRLLMHEQHGAVQGVSAHGRHVGTKSSLRVLSNSNLAVTLLSLLWMT